MRKKFDRCTFLFSGLVLATVGVSACGDGAINPAVGQVDEFTALCMEIQPDLVPGAPRDGIPALTDPVLVSVGDGSADYLLPTDRVIGLALAANT